MDVIDTWLLILGLFHLLLFIFSLFFFVPKKIIQTPLKHYFHLFFLQKKYLIIILFIVAFHLIEVNLLDSYFTSIVGNDFAASIHHIENGVVHWFSQHWTPALLYIFVFIYIVVYPFTLWFSPFYFIITKDTKAISTLAYGLVFIYVVALPFYLFLPITNVYTFYGTESALEMVIPSVEIFFYSTTTFNNCFPSLHVAMTILIAQSVSLTKNKRYTYFTYLCAVLVVISVIYLSIHWITDVLGGILLAIGAFYLQRTIIKEK